MSLFFFFHATATTEIYTLSLHDALPIWSRVVPRHGHDRLLSDQKLAGGLGILELRAVLEPGRRTGVKEISSAGHLALKAAAGKGRHQFLQPSLVFRSRADGDRVVIQGQCRRILDRPELAAVAVVLDVGQGSHNGRIAANPADPPADHIE